MVTTFPEMSKSTSRPLARGRQAAASSGAPSEAGDPGRRGLRSTTSGGFGLSLQLAQPAPLEWWRRQESNLRPPACKAGALPTELRPRSRRGGPMWTRTTDLTLIRRTL